MLGCKHNRLVSVLVVNMPLIFAQPLITYLEKFSVVSFYLPSNFACSSVSVRTVHQHVYNHITVCTMHMGWSTLYIHSAQLPTHLPPSTTQGFHVTRPRHLPYHRSCESVALFFLNIFLIYKKFMLYF